MTTVQKTLFEELNEVAKKPYQVTRPLILTRDDYIPSGNGIIFPCLIARRLSIDERSEHMKYCDACKRIEKELDDSVGIVQEHGVWY